MDEALVVFCETPKTRDEVVQFIGMAKTHALKEYIKPLVKSGKLFYTLPNVPLSSLQRFVSERGKQYIMNDDVVVAFCETPKSADEIAAFVGIDKARFISIT
jgi:hypothetical protein